MKKAGIILLICVAVGVILLLGLIFYPELSAKYIKNELLKLNYCEIKEDCILVHGKCPIGSIYVNKNEVEKAKNLVKLVPMTCMYSAKYINDSLKECAFGRCVINYNHSNLNTTA